MIWKRLRFCLICLLLWPAAIFVANRIEAFLAPVLWWLARQSGKTTLSRAVFDTDAWLPLSLIEGFVLGWVPILRLKTLALDIFAAGRLRPPATEHTEMSPKRPLLWAWVLPTALFAVRFTTWGRHTDESVLTGAVVTTEPGRIAHFFGPIGNFSQTLPWFYDRLFLTSPMLFAGSYALAVCLRHRLPDLRHPIPLPAEGEAAVTLGSEPPH